MRANSSRRAGIYVSCIVVFGCKNVLLVSPLRGDVRTRVIGSFLGCIRIWANVGGSEDKVAPSRDQFGFRKIYGRL